MNNDDWIHSDDDRFFYENIEHKDYYGNMPKLHKAKSSTNIILWLIGIVIAIFTWDSPAVLFFYILFVISGKISGAF